MKRAQPNGKRQFLFAAIAISMSMFSSAHVPARDQGYLDTINAEAQKLEEVGNTDINSQDVAPVVSNPVGNDSTPHPTDSQESFLQKINSTLYSEPNNAAQDESAYLKQLEKEVQKLDGSPRRSATAAPAAQSNRNQAVKLQADKDKLIQVTEAQRKEMEIALETKLPGIYRLYKKLGLTQKKLVVKEYLDNKRVSAASKTVLKLYGGN